MPATKDDAFDASQKDGRIRFTMDGTDYVLRRPKIKEFRTIREQLMDLAKKAGATDEEAEAVAKGKTADVDRDLWTEREDELLSWYAEVFAMLEEKAQPLPGVEDAPTWLLGRGIMTEMMQAWLNRPAPPGR